MSANSFDYVGRLLDIDRSDLYRTGRNCEESESKTKVVASIDTFNSHSQSSTARPSKNTETAPLQRTSEINLPHRPASITSFPHSLGNDPFSISQPFERQLSHSQNFPEFASSSPSRHMESLYSVDRSKTVVRAYESPCVIIQQETPSFPNKPFLGTSPVQPIHAEGVLENMFFDSMLNGGPYPHSFVPLHPPTETENFPSISGTNILSLPPTSTPVTRAYTPVVPELKDKIYKVSLESDEKLLSLKKSDPDTNRLDPKEEFGKFSHLLIKLTAHDIPEFLVGCLKDNHKWFSLEELFNLLFNEKFSHSDSASTAASMSTGSYKYPESNTPGLEFCRLMLNSFAGEYTSLTENTQIPSSNLREILRNVLAIKILLVSVRRVEHGVMGSYNIPKTSVYKVYCILCQKLLQRHPIRPIWTVKDIILDQPRLGRLINLVYPNLPQKRLGRRGDSKFHYIGLMWNSAMVDEDTLNMSELEMSEIDEYFEYNRDTTGPIITEIHPDERTSVVDKDITVPAPKPFFLQFSFPSAKATYSFVEVSRQFPHSNCAPRVWKSTSSTIPSRTQWADINIQRSLSVLKCYSIDLEPLTSLFSGVSFPQNSQASLYNIVRQTIISLLHSSAPKEAYMNLYLVVLLLIFPAIVSSDQEVPLLSKIQLRGSLNNCASMLESEFTDIEAIDSISLRAFIRILKKMVALNEMTSCKVKDRYTESVLKVMINDLEMAWKSQADQLTGRSPVHQILLESVIKALNAYDIRIVNGMPASNEKDVMEIISTFANFLSNGVKLSIDLLLVLLEDVKNPDLKPQIQDLPCQIFKIGLQLLHDVTLANPIVTNFPMPVITFMILHTSNWLQNSSFHGFGNRDRELSKETFKSWWILSTMLQEYMGIIAEVVALSEILSQGSQESTNVRH